MNVIFDQTLYVTPSGWGEQIVANEREMLVTVAQMRAMGGDWVSCDIQECQKINLIGQVGRYALYSAFHSHDYGYSYELYEPWSNSGYFKPVLGTCFTREDGDDNAAIEEARELIS